VGVALIDQHSLSIEGFVTYRRQNLRYRIEMYSTFLEINSAGDHLLIHSTHRDSNKIGIIKVDVDLTVSAYKVFGETLSKAYSFSPSATCVTSDDILIVGGQTETAEETRIAYLYAFDGDLTPLWGLGGAAELERWSFRDLVCQEQQVFGVLSRFEKYTYEYRSQDCQFFSVDVTSESSRN